MQVFDVVEYVNEKGVSPFGEWLRALDTSPRGRIVIALARMRDGNLADTKGVGDGVFENRLDFGAGYRIYFARDGERILLLLAGGTKRRQEKDIARAKLLWRTYKLRDRGE